MKKVMKTALVAASFFALAATASAATVEVNMYGASAENSYWTTVAPLFMQATVADGGLECATVWSDRSTTGKDGVAVGTACVGAGGNDVIIRYSARASFEGPRSVSGVDPDNLDNCPTDFERHMIDESTCDHDPATKDCEATKCVDITLGASDVDGSSFSQESHGCLDGHVTSVAGASCVGQVDGDGNSLQRDIILDPATIPTAGLDTYRPIVVPFKFFVNTALTNVNNLTRLQAVLLFNGNVTNWSQFGSSYPNKKVVVCLRHAGSGTHATLDNAVMRGDMSLVTNQSVPPGFLDVPVVWFNESSSNLMDCVRDNGSDDGDLDTTNILTGQPVEYAAVGYADADKQDSDLTRWPTSQVKAVTYNGADASAENITNGTYSFWSAQWIYEDPNEPGYSDKHPIAQKMMDYASDELNMPASKAAYWVTQNQMVVKKANDFVLPQF